MAMNTPTVLTLHYGRVESKGNTPDRFGPCLLGEEIIQVSLFFTAFEERASIRRQASRRR
jgi:hypothetical protein